VALIESDYKARLSQLETTHRQQELMSINKIKNLETSLQESSRALQAVHGPKRDIKSFQNDAAMFQPKPTGPNTLKPGTHRTSCEGLADANYNYTAASVGHSKKGFVSNLGSGRQKYQHD